MKANEIQIGGRYTAKVSGNLTTVRVDAIRDYFAEVFGRVGRNEKRYDVTNLTTGRRITFRSAAKFRSRVLTDREYDQRRREEYQGNA